MFNIKNYFKELVRVSRLVETTTPSTTKIVSSETEKTKIFYHVVEFRGTLYVINNYDVKVVKNIDKFKRCYEYIYDVATELASETTDELSKLRQLKFRIIPMRGIPKVIELTPKRLTDSELNQFNPFGVSVFNMADNFYDLIVGQYIDIFYEKEQIGETEAMGGEIVSISDMDSGERIITLSNNDDYMCHFLASNGSGIGKDSIYKLGLPKIARNSRCQI